MVRKISAVFSGAVLLLTLPTFLFSLEIDHETRRGLGSDIRTEMTTRGPAVAEELLVQYKGEDTFRVEKLERGARVEEAARAFGARPNVEYAEPNYIAHTFMTPNDAHFQYQWNFPKIGVPAAWDTSNGTGVTVAIIDTGVAYENFSQSGKTYSIAPDLANTAFAAGYDFVNNDMHPNDDNSHGTHVAGTVAQSTNNTEGTAGIAYGATIMPIKVLNASGSGTYAAIANGIRFAADNGAKVVNLSLGGSSGSQTLEDALKYAFDKGVTIVAASGNDGTGTVSYPAAYNAYVIAVGATRFDNTRAKYSNYGSALDIVAPGGDTAVDQNGDGYGDGILQQTFSGSNYGAFGYYFFQGTSMATPHVVGVAALVIAHGNATTPADVRTALESTADDLGSVGRDNTYGYGLVDPVGALAWSAAPIEPPPPPPEEPPVEEPPPPPTEIEIFADSFEVAEWNGLWTEDSQNDWSRSNQRATDGTRSAEIDGNANNAALTSIPINLQGKANARITFSWLIESSLDTNEYVMFEISTNNGSSWQEKARLRGNVESENTWHSA
ncbi:MAG: S8 family peptidase, partial [Patescibacteria group bacterium]